MDLGRQDACWKKTGESMAPWIFPFSKGQARGAAGDLVVLAIPWKTRDSKQQLQGTPNTRKTWKNVLQLKLWWWRGGKSLSLMSITEGKFCFFPLTGKLKMNN